MTCRGFVPGNPRIAKPLNAHVPYVNGVEQGVQSGSSLPLHIPNHGTKTVFNP